MTERRPLVLDSDCGYEELPDGDTVPMAPAAPLRIMVLSDGTSTNLNAAATDNLVPFGVEIEKDVGFTHSTVTNNSRFTVTADGTYQVSLILRLVGDPASGIRYQGNGRLRKNGTVDIVGRAESVYTRFNSSIDHSGITATWDLKLLAGDYLEVLIDRDSTRSDGMDMEPNCVRMSIVNLAAGPKGDTGGTSRVKYFKPRLDDDFYSGGFSRITGYTMTAGSLYGKITMGIPDDCISITSCKLVMLPAVTDAAYNIFLEAEYGGIGELYYDGYESGAKDAAFTTDYLAELEISDVVLTSVVAGDTVGLNIELNEGGGASVLLIHAILEYEVT